MENTNELIQTIEKARKKAAKFFKIDLHVHSQESDDFPKLGDKENCANELTAKDRSPSYQDFIEAAQNVNDLRLIAITDHNKSRVSAALAKFSKESYSEIVILPGMEVALQVTIFPDSQIHVLTIFPEHFSSEDIQQILHSDSGMPKYEDRTSASVAKIPLDSFISCVHKMGGICIAGHVNSNKGVRSFFRDNSIKLLKIRLTIKELERRFLEEPENEEIHTQLIKLKEKNKKLEDSVQDQYLELLSEYKFDGVEVRKSSDSLYYSGVPTTILGIRDIPCLLGSDAHNLQDIVLEGYPTYVKMTQPGFRDLSKALKDPGTRIRYEDTISRHRSPRILGIHFQGGFFKTHTIGFSDNLTCLIGGRGTGKSACLEALRKVLELDLSHLGDDKQNDIFERVKHTLSETTIFVLFDDANGERFILSQSFGETTKCYDDGGGLLSTINVSKASKFRVKIYGWGEIEELARNKREQLNLIDGFIPESTAYLNSINDLRRKLEKNTHQIITYVSEIEDLLPRIEELPAKEITLSRLSTKGLNEIFEDFDKNKAAESAIEVLGSEISDLFAKLTNDEDEPYDFEEAIKLALDTANDAIVTYNWATDFVGQIKAGSSTLENQYKELLSQFENIRQITADKIVELDEERIGIELELTRKAKKTDLDDDQEGGISSLINHRRRLTKEVSDLRAIKKQIIDKQTRVDGKLEYRFENILPSLQTERRELTKLRKTKIRDINQRLANLSSVAKVSILLEHQKEREAFRVALGAPEPKMSDGILKNVCKWYKRDKYAGLYAQRHSPHTFVQAILNPDKDFSNLRACRIEENTVREVIDAKKAQRVAEHLTPYLEDDSPYFSAEKLEKLLEIENCDTEDFPVICLDKQPIEELSPGQRCGTLIPIILLESNCPLIIDQPEDNLDNKLVFDLIVDIIRSLKEQRQLIVATHDPNIPVSGDAEQIIVFDALSHEFCEINDQGSIDDDNIVNQIKTIMEGSEEAFQIRAEKYGYRLEKE